MLSEPAAMLDEMRDARWSISSERMGEALEAEGGPWQDAAVPELPDITVYVECLERRVRGAALLGLRLASPFLLRTVDPPAAAFAGKRVARVGRLGKRIVFAFDDELYLVVHLMVAGRFRWLGPGAPIPRKLGLLGLDFDAGTVLLTEASSKKRAALHLLRGEAALRSLDRGGLEPRGSTLEAFSAAMVRESHTLKRALTDPRLVSGIGNAYSDEILHRARLSPLRLTSQLTAEEMARLHRATLATLELWISRLRAEVGDGFPEKVTAFREEMAVHGRYRKPCPDCGAEVQRIVHAENELNYCANCQTGGKLLADRALSRLLRRDWPKTLEELEELRNQARSP